MEEMEKACDLCMITTRDHDQSRRSLYMECVCKDEITYVVLSASKSPGMPWSNCYTRGHLRHDPMVSRRCLPTVVGMNEARWHGFFQQS
jgi:hypothetical protein